MTVPTPILKRCPHHRHQKGRLKLLKRLIRVLWFRGFQLSLGGYMNLLKSHNSLFLFFKICKVIFYWEAFQVRFMSFEELWVKSISNWMLVVLYNLLYFFKTSKLFHVVTPALYSISTLNKKSHDFKNFSESEVINNFTDANALIWILFYENRQRLYIILVLSLTRFQN